MARQELGPAALAVAQAVAGQLPAGPVVVGCSGGADSLALTLGAAWAASKKHAELLVLVIDHGLQAGSQEVADNVVAQLQGLGLSARGQRVEVLPGADGLEAAAREARLAALQAPGHPVLLGHTMDDQAENVLLGLLRGSGTRSLAGMANRNGKLIRPLLGLRRAITEQACREWELEPWQDPMNSDERFSRVRVRRTLVELSVGLGRDLVPALARTATLSRLDADYLDELAAGSSQQGPALSVSELEELPAALRLRVIHGWLESNGVSAEFVHVLAVSELVTSWRGQGPLSLPGGTVRRREAVLHFEPV